MHRLKKGLLLLSFWVWAAIPGAWPAAAKQDGGPEMRVGLILQAPKIGFAVEGSYQLVDCATQKVVSRPAPGQNFEVRFAPGGLELSCEGQRVGVFAGPLLVREEVKRVAALARGGSLSFPEAPVYALGAQGRQASAASLSGLSVIAAGGKTVRLAPERGTGLVALSYQGERRRYRGNMELRADGQGITAINRLPLEEYLYAVVPSEMPAYWPPEALKAQAVAARSYALVSRSGNSGQAYDLLADQRSQVYRGYDAEHPAATRAVEETRGVVLTYRNQVASAVFHSSSGGYTENSEDVWAKKVDYLRSRPDPYDRHPSNPHYNWSVTYTAEQLKEQLASRGYRFGQVYDLEVLERTSSGARVKALRVIGTDEQGKPLVVEIGRDPTKARADEVRRALGLKSALFTLEKTYSAAPGQQPRRLAGVTFRGSGWGHGLGMSQYGALGLAEKGYSYQEILSYYYPGTALAPNYGEKAAGDAS
ncbi:SpoIID/LytB domain-containing protein [Desulfovirgula thermocuniculi]|uniref:SpoIID/LytB domain-containing protein n=1 Tax=Desulfovirgula thermocuniculi TaxID=348842 RepID=UPI000403478E|nr:SpoIID/LytB domain-containing protein [Desulfovirgula thermocuniculi]